MYDPYTRYLNLLKEVIPLELKRDIDDEECANMRKEMEEIYPTLNNDARKSFVKIEFAIKADSLKKCNILAQSCRLCNKLCESRNSVVFGEGNINARLVLLGEAPGEDEDKQGKPFVGRSGKMLDQILEKANLSRDNVYVLNILKCRPPGNRNPYPDEAANCRKFLDAQIKCIRPKYIMCLGLIASQNLLNTYSPLSTLRQIWHSYGQAKVLCTYHPSALLRFKKYQDDAWKDWKLLLNEMSHIYEV